VDANVDGTARVECPTCLTYKAPGEGPNLAKKSGVNVSCDSFVYRNRYVTEYIIGHNRSI
jgi:hypothetical protein